MFCPKHNKSSQIVVGVLANLCLSGVELVHQMVPGTWCLSFNAIYNLFSFDCSAMEEKGHFQLTRLLKVKMLRAGQHARCSRFTEVSETSLFPAARSSNATGAVMRLN